MSRAARSVPSIAAITATAAIAIACTACRRAETPAIGAPAGSSTAERASPHADATASSPCTELPFAESTPVPEASGAAWLPIDGAPRLVVISDSGNDGAYAIVDPETGATREQGKLPLGAEGEDLEGIAARGGKLHVITSAGWIRVYERSGRGFALVDGPYPLGPLNLHDTGGGMGDHPPVGTGMVCGARYANCGRNYEGMCLAQGRPAGRCVGFAVAKADGHLYCLVEDAGRLQVEHAGAIEIERPGVLSDCAITDDGRLYVGTNMFNFGNVYRVTGWEDPPRAQVTRIAPLLIGNPETLAISGDTFYVMSDTGRAPSFMKKYRCPGR
jgi:hypothetical protein